MNRHTVEASGSMKQIMIMIAELDGSLYLSGVVPGLDLAEGMGSQLLSGLLELMELMERQVILWNEIIHREIR